MKRTILKLGLICLLAGLAWLYKTHDPAHEKKLFPPCPLHAATGIQCPGCGSQRAAHALLNGDIGRAWQNNPLLLFFLPYLIIAGLAEYAQIHVLGKKGSDFLTSRIVIWTFFAIIVLFWIFRNVL